MNKPLIRLASHDDFSALGIIGPSAYAESYSYAWNDPAGYAAYLHTFGRDALEQLPADTLIWVAELGGWVVGFLQMKCCSLDPIAHRPNGAEVQRIYILKPSRGKGLGVALLTAAEIEARARGAEYLWLLTMRSATWAQKTYEGWGFAKVGELHYPKLELAHEQQLYVLTREINSSRPPKTGTSIP
jgi:GNAT superfamily N-acetyltransferase